MSATPQGVEQDIHSRLMGKLAPEPEPVDPIDSEIVEEEIPEELEAAEADTGEIPVEEESVEAEPSEIEAQEGEPSEAQIELSDIAEYLGVEPDKFAVTDDGELMVKTKIDGVEGEAKFSDLLKSYQLEGHLNKQSTEVAEAKKALQSKLAEADTQLSQKLQQLEDLSQIAYNELLGEYNAIDWNELRADDPAEYAAKLADFQNRQSQIGQLYQKAQDQRQQLEATESEGLKEKIAEEGQKLLKAIPEWTDPVKYQEGWAETTKYAQTLGFSQDEVNSTIDHRMLVLLNKARQFDALKEKSPTVTQRVRKAPKIAKPGSTASKVPSQVQKEQALKAKLKRDGGGKALHDLLLSRV